MPPSGVDSTIVGIHFGSFAGIHRERRDHLRGRAMLAETNFGTHAPGSAGSYSPARSRLPFSLASAAWLRMLRDIDDDSPFERDA